MKEAAFAAGVDEFAVKTQDVSVLRARVSNLLSRARNVVGRRVAPTDPDREPAATPPAGAAFFARVVAASGLSEVLGASVIQRACERVGLRPDEVGPATLGRALPEIERRLSLFLSPSEARRGLDSIAALASGGAAGRSGERAGRGRG